MMRKFLFALAAAGSALAVAAPASAQYYPAQYGHRYDNFGQVRALQARIDAVERQIRFLDRRDVVRDDRADRLREEARDIERYLHRASRNGLSPYEADRVNARIARLEQRVQFAVNRRGGYRRY
jgi:hypothetical protein